MTVFFTSDPHIGHRLVSQIRWQRAFPGIAPPTDAHMTRWHDSILAQNWDMTVSPKDQVWVLGDLAMGGRANINNALAWIAERPGQKHLILGNHDKAHPKNRDSHRWLSLYNTVFASVQTGATRAVSLSPHQRTEILLSHFPYFGDRDDTDRYTQWRLRDEGSWLLHGHLHSTEATSQDRPRMIDMGVDAWGLYPASLDDIVTIISGHSVGAGGVLA
jgi:calcineurin-like phosphoesterase family protein